MKKLSHVGLILIALLATGFAYTSYADTEQFGTRNNSAHDFYELKRDIKKNTEDVEILRRDEINYHLEKEVLKETYETTLQKISFTATIVSTAVGIVFAIFGYVGFRTVGKLKDDYLKELQEARTLKSSLEIEIDALRKKQEQAEADIANLSKAQGTKIELLEIVEKASNLFRNGQYSWAIEHLKAGLDIDSTYYPLLSLYASCEYRQGNFEAAIDIYKKIGKLPELEILNYAELLLLTNRINEYDEFYAKNREVVDKAHGGNLVQFFNVLREILLNKIDESKRIFQSYVSSCPVGASAKLGTWQFDEFQRIITALPIGELKTLAENAKGYFAGAITTEAMRECLSQ
jgi:tetratricopeptide (TPR) repeat protein